MIKQVIISIDCEQDCPPYMHTYRGITEGIPRLLNLFEEKQIKSTFFSTGDVAKRYPTTMQAIVDSGHELGSHGYTHKNFNSMSYDEAYSEIAMSVDVLSKFQDTVSFRAPYLNFPDRFYPLLQENNIHIDSSRCRYKKPFTKDISTCDDVLVVPASITSSLLRLPLPMITPWIKNINPLVLFVHPWEFVDLRKTTLRLDCRFNTGDKAVAYLSKWISFLQSKSYHFTTINLFGNHYANQLLSI